MNSSPTDSGYGPRDISLNAEFRDRLLQNEKLASIGQIAAGVAHEINNPIGYLGSNLNALHDYMATLLRVADSLQCQVAESGAGGARDGEKLSSEDLSELAYIRDDLPVLMRESLEGIERIRRTVKDLKDFSRMDDIAFEWADIHDTLRSSLNIVHYELKHVAEVELNSGTVPLIWCSPSQMSQVFVNILLNAAQAMPRQGKVTITTRQQGDWVEIAIADNGPGMPRDVQQRIFDPFFTTKPAGTGTGLGLPISAKIVADHQGVLTVDSEPGKGTCFMIRVPIECRASQSGK